MTWRVLEICNMQTGELRRHVYPEGDLRPHYSCSCWCMPAVDAEFGIVEHFSMDGREAFERGERLTS